MTPESLKVLCQMGSDLHFPNVDGARLLHAIAGVESSFGSNDFPRHEQSYCYGSKAYGRSKELRDLTLKYGCWAHCSYGIWQMMLVNMTSIDSTVELPDIISDFNKQASLTIRFIQRLIDTQHLKTLGEVADAYNSGNARDDYRPIDYIGKVKQCYENLASVYSSS